ncbi:MAG TPA: hypothetical protein VH253_02005 [Phycisphaerae bacterium]|nr:hypothetical protein [Phycisphaerae bacterium]
MQLKDILQMNETPLRDVLNEAVRVVDGIHSFPFTHRFPLVVSAIRKDQGLYHYRTRPSSAEKIEISRHAIFPQLTLVHEVGHFLDHLALNPIKREFATDHDPAFEPLLHLWAESPEVRAAATLLANFGKTQTKASRAALRYYLTPRELWARSYMQWVVTRSSQPDLTRQLHLLHASGWAFAGRRCTFQWDANSFKPIMNAVDKLMESAGLL